MIEEFKKSVNSILYERVTSPFWGAFIVSWIICNWEILYLTIFVSEDRLSLNKLDYIHRELNLNVFSLIIYPLIIAFCILTILPFLSNGAYWIFLRFRNWRVMKKRQIEETVSLSIKESLDLRTELLKQEERFQKLNIEKDQRITNLNNQLIELQSNLDKQREQLVEKNKSFEVTKKDIEYYKDKNNYNKVFRGDWSYELKGQNKLLLELYNESRIEFTNKGVRKVFDIHTISRQQNQRFELFLIQERIDINKPFDMKYISLKRSESNIENFEGYEVSFSRDADGATFGDFNEVKLKKI